MDFSQIARVESNLLTPIPLCFALGIICKVVHGGIKIPKELYYTISIYLLMAIGFIGGHELAKAGLGNIWKPALATLFLGCVTPISAFVLLYFVGRFNAADSAGIAAHYGSTSAVTFAVAKAFVADRGTPADGYLPTLVTILECPGIAIALAIGAALMAKKHAAPGAEHDPSAPPVGNIKEALYEVITGQSIMLMAGLLVIGYISFFFVKPENFEPFEDFFKSGGPIFRGALCIFLLEMGLVAGERLADLKKAGPFLIAFGILLPICHGFLAAWLGTLAGLSVGGATVFAAIVSSASYIAAPPAVRMTLPDANPTLSITASLAITFPFNIAFGIPLYYEMAKWLTPAVAS